MSQQNNNLRRVLVIGLLLVISAASLALLTHKTGKGPAPATNTSLSQHPGKVTPKEKQAAAPVILPESTERSSRLVTICVALGACAVGIYYYWNHKPASQQVSSSPRLEAPKRTHRPRGAPLGQHGQSSSYYQERTYKSLPNPHQHARPQDENQHANTSNRRPDLPKNAMWQYLITYICSFIVAPMLIWGIGKYLQAKPNTSTATWHRKYPNTLEALLAIAAEICIGHAIRTATAKPSSNTGIGNITPAQDNIRGIASLRRHSTSPAQSSLGFQCPTLRETLLGKLPILGHVIVCEFLKNHTQANPRSAIANFFRKWPNTLMHTPQLIINIITMGINHNNNNLSLSLKLHYTILLVLYVPFLLQDILMQYTEANPSFYNSNLYYCCNMPLTFITFFATIGWTIHSDPILALTFFTFAPMIWAWVYQRIS